MKLYGICFLPLLLYFHLTRRNLKFHFIDFFQLVSFFIDISFSFFFVFAQLIKMEELIVSDTNPYSAIHIHNFDIELIIFEQTYELIINILPRNVNTIMLVNNNTSIQLTESNESIQRLYYSDIDTDPSGIRVDFTKLPGLDFFNTNIPHVPMFISKMQIEFQKCNMNRIYPRPKGEFRHVKLILCEQTEQNIDVFGDMDIQHLELNDTTFFNDILPKLPTTMKTLHLRNYVAGFTNLPQSFILFASNKCYIRDISREKVKMKDLLVGPNVFNDIDHYYRKYPDTPEIQIFVQFCQCRPPVRILDFFKKMKTELAKDVFHMNVIEHNCTNSTRTSPLRLTRQTEKIANMRTLLDVGDIKKTIREFLKGSGEYLA